MAAENEISIEAARRRRRRVALLVALISAMLASVFFADFLSRPAKSATAWTSDSRFPKFTERFFRRHGVTVSIAQNVVHNGQGGPEDTGPWIDENELAFARREIPVRPIASASSSLPTRKFSTAARFGGPGGSIGGGPGAGGPGGGIVVCDKPDGSATTLPELAKLCPDSTKESEPGAKEGAPVTIVTVTGSPGLSGPTGPAGLSGDDPAGSGQGGGTPPTSPPPSITPISAVPEPESWATMIAGFLLTGMAIRSHGARVRAQRRAMAV